MATARLATAITSSGPIHAGKSHAWSTAFPPVVAANGFTLMEGPVQQATNHTE